MPESVIDAARGPDGLAGYTALIPAAGSSRRLARLTRSRPKSLIEFAGKAIIEHGLDVLAGRGVRRAILVVGYHREALMDRLGDRRGDLHIEYVHSPDFATTEHGWSLCLGLRAWQRARGPLLLVDADNLYDPAILDALAGTPDPDVVMVDRGLVATDRDEELVRGEAGRVAGLVRGRSDALPDGVGGFIGINKLSTAFAGALLGFMNDFFPEHGRGFKYERVIDRFLDHGDHPLHYLDCGGRPWINVNYESEFPAALRVAELMRTDR